MMSSGGSVAETQARSILRPESARRLDLVTNVSSPVQQVVETNVMRDMRLPFMPPILKNGEPVACLQKEEVRGEIAK